MLQLGRDVASTVALTALLGAARRCAGLRLMLPGKTYDVEDVIDIASRGKWLLCLTFLSLTLGSAILAYSLPSRWVSPRFSIALNTYRNPTSGRRWDRPQDRLESIRRDILSRPRLEQIIREFNCTATRGRPADGRRGQPDAERRCPHGLDERRCVRGELSRGRPALARRVASRRRRSSSTRTFDNARSWPRAPASS